MTRRTNATIAGFTYLFYIALVGLPLKFTQVLIGVVNQLIWIPVAVFELVVAVWLMVKGVPSPEMSR